MRHDQRLSILEKVIDNQLQIQMDTQPRYNGTAQEINNWSDIKAALQELLKQGWVAEQDAVRDIIETPKATPGQTDNSIVFDQQEYDVLEMIIRETDQFMPAVINVIRSFTKRDDDDVIYIEIGTVQTSDELETAIDEITSLLKIVNIGGAFEFKGFAQGSDWLTYIADANTIVAFTMTAVMATKYMARKKQLIESGFKFIANYVSKRQNPDADVSDEDTDEMLDSLLQEEFQDDWKEIEDFLQAHLEQERANEALVKVKQATKNMTEQMNKGRSFEPPRKTLETINVSGDWNTINILENRIQIQPSQLQSPQETEIGDE